MRRNVLRIAILLVAVAYLYPLILVDEGLDSLPEQARQLGLEALAGAKHHFSNPIERLWITRFRIMSFDEPFQTFVVRVHTLFGVPYSDVEIRPRGPNPALTVVRPRLWWLGRTGP